MELETRVSELEVELSVWKQAHATALDSSERQVNAHNVQLSTLNRQISSLESFKVRHYHEWFRVSAVAVIPDTKSSYSMHPRR
jgi:hypothetical protein